MTWSFPIGILFGAQYRVHATFVLLMLWIGVAGTLESGIMTGLADAAFTIALLFSVIAHEAGHALMARRFGTRASRVTLLPIGGIAVREGPALSTGKELAIAFSGPAASFTLFVMLYTVGSFLDSVTFFEDPRSDTNYWHLLALVNLYLGAFNLLPAFPMDGGRILFTLLHRHMPGRVATRIARTAGHLAAFAFGLWGLTSGQAELLLISIFIILADALENPWTSKRSGRNVISRDLLVTNFERLFVNDDYETAIEVLDRSDQENFPVFDNRRFVGIIKRSQLAFLAHQTPPRKPMQDIIQTNTPVMLESASLNEISKALDAQQSSVAMIADNTGEVLGYITRDRIHRAPKDESAT